MARDFTSTSRFRREEFALPRLHWLTWLTVVACSIAVVLLVIPGHGVEPPTLLARQPFMWGRSAGSGPMPDPDLAVGPLFVEEYKHGWPFTYLHRAVGAGGQGWPKGIRNAVVIGWPSGGSIAPWDHRLAWSFYGDVSHWSSAALAADLVIALILIAAPTVICQWWIVRRGGCVRFRIVDLLAAAALVAAALAWHQSHLQLQSVEGRLIAALPAPGALLKSSWRDHRWEYRGPLWFDRLLGLANYRCFRHLHQVTVIVEEMTNDDWRLLSQAAYVSDVRLHGRISAEAAHALASLEHLQSLELCSGVGGIDPILDPAPEQQRLYVLKFLENIRCYRSDLLIEDMDAIAAIQTLKEIDVSGVLATIDEQHAFRGAHPRLIVKCDEQDRSTEETRGVDPWEVACARLVRWRDEDSVTLGVSYEQRHALDLRGIELKTERLLKLQPVLSSAKHLSFDKSAEIPAVIELLRECRNVTTINAIGLPTNRELLKSLIRLPTLSEVELSQGTASVDDLLQLNQLKNLYSLELYEVSFTQDETVRLADELKVDGFLEAYRGLDEAEPVIEASTDEDQLFDF